MSDSRPADFMRVKDCRHGRMMYNVNDVYIGRSLDVYGEYCEGEMTLLGQMLRPGDVVIDAGANIGVHTTFFAKAVRPGGVVLAYEPQRLVYQTLCGNVALNGLLNVWCFQQAVGEAGGVIRVPQLDPRVASNFGGLPLAQFQHEQGEDVPVVRLDALPLTRCALIKVDVEGMELAALRGAAGLVSKFRPALYVENDRPELSDPLVRHLDAAGYACYWHHVRLFNPDNFFRHAANVFADVESRNMICLPKEKPHRLDGAQRVAVPA